MRFKIHFKRASLKFVGSHLIVILLLLAAYFFMAHFARIYFVLDVFYLWSFAKIRLRTSLMTWHGVETLLRPKVAAIVLIIKKYRNVFTLADNVLLIYMYQECYYHDTHILKQNFLIYKTVFRIRIKTMQIRILGSASADSDPTLWRYKTYFKMFLFNCSCPYTKDNCLTCL